MKFKILLPLILLAGMTVVGCEKPSSGGGSSKYKVEITNKTELQAEWYAGPSSHRDLSVTLTPEANPLVELNNGNLTIKSSNTTVASVTGFQINALSEGTARINVSYHGAKDYVDITISHEQTIPEKYNVEHYGTAEDPLTNEEALSIAKNPLYEEGNEDLYVGGTIASFYHAPGARTDGYVSWFLQPAEEGGEKFEIYKCKKSDGTALTDDDVWVNGYAIAHGKFTSFGTQYETSEAVFYSCEGNKPAPRVTLVKTFAEAFAFVQGLADGADTYDYFQVDCYVTKKSGENYFLTATKGEEITDEKANTIELFAVKDADAVAKLTKDAKVTITMVLKNYHSQVENLFTVDATQINVLEEGGTWDVVPEPEVTVRSLADFIAGENTKAVAYKVTAEIKAFKSGDTKDQYGNMTLTDGTNDLIIYGCSATATALAWNNADAYVFTNPKDFLTNATTSALAIGDTVEMKLIRADYNTTIEGTGIILSVTPGGGGGEEVPEPEVTVRSLADFIAGENTKAVAYKVTAQIKAFKDGETKDKYGNMTLTDGTNDLIIYGCSATATALVWNNKDSYSFTNPKDFLTDATTSAMNIGDTVEMKLIRADYNTTIEGTGIILSVTPGEVPELTGISVSPETQTVDVYEAAGTATFTVSPEPARAELGEVEWSFVDEHSTLTMADGVVTIPQDAVAEDGELRVRIMATCGDFNDVATLIVTKDSSGGGEQTLENVDFSVLSSEQLGSSELTDKAALLKAINNASIKEISDMSKVYAGNATQGPKITGLKLGTGSAAGTITFVLAAKVSEVNLVAYAWSSTKLATVSINGQETTFVAADASAARTINAQFAEPTDTITISFSMYAVATALNF